MQKKFSKHSASMPKRLLEAVPTASAADAAQWRPLTREFFDAPPEQVARLLLGKILVRRGAGVQLAGRIVETEAYLGEHDAAAHAASGRTARNAVLYGSPGHAYIYNIYGLHACLNVSCLQEGDPGGVLFRALEPLRGIAEMRRNRGLDCPAGIDQLTSGPGKLCQAFGITRAKDNGLDFVSAKSRLGLVEDDFRCEEIRVTPRIGISKAADWPLRFFLAENACVSGRRR
jgi:DNA-3-methyladenine glycosylase